MRKLLGVILIVLFVNLSYSQIFSEEFRNPILQKDSSNLIFIIDNQNFLKNNEYFNDFTEGYTLPGYFLNTVFTWRPSKKTAVTGGVHLQKYSGVQDFSQVLPVYRFQFQASDNFSIILGTTNNSENHHMLDPIFEGERYLTNHIENGVQIIYKSTNFKSDVWLDWRQFIFEGSDYPEKFTFGTSNRFFLLPADYRHQFSLHFQSIITHIGGQIDNSNIPVESLMNTASGFEYQNKTGSITWGVNETYFTFTDISPKKQYPYLQGYGILSEILAEKRGVKFAAFHWYGKYFMSPMGNPLYSSVSETYQSYSEPLRALVGAKVLWKKSFFEIMNVGVDFSAYFDLYNRNTDYSFGIYLSYKQDFTIIK